MIIAIDGYEANVANRVGIGRYAFEILRHMHSEIKNPASPAGRQKSIIKNLEFRVYLPSSPLSDLPEETNWWRYRIARPQNLWTFIGLPLALMTDLPRADVVFSPTHYVPRFVSLSRIMAIMDLSYLKYPQMFGTKDIHQLTRWTAYSVRHAAKILTISQFSKNAIIKAYGVPEERVVVTYPGFSEIKNEKLIMKNVLEKYKIAKSYILSVGTLQPRKNFERLIEAFTLLRKDLELVIVGKKGWLYEDILLAPKRFGVEDRVKFLDFVPDEDLAFLYTHAACLALPSLYEGFGLPVLEALAHRCPVVVSRVSSLPEIAGEAGIYVDPEDVGSIVKGLKGALEESKEDRKRRIEEGLRQVKKFSWEKAARETLNILEEVANVHKDSL